MLPAAPQAFDRCFLESTGLCGLSRGQIWWDNHTGSHQSPAKDLWIRHMGALSLRHRLWGNVWEVCVQRHHDLAESLLAPTARSKETSLRTAPFEILTQSLEEGCFWIPRGCWCCIFCCGTV